VIWFRSVHISYFLHYRHKLSHRRDPTFHCV